MVEGNGVWRTAAKLRILLLQRILQIKSPNGSFASGAQSIDGWLLVAVKAIGKNLFLTFESKAGAEHGLQVVHLHFGMSGGFALFRKEDDPGPRPTSRLRMECQDPEIVGYMSGIRCNLLKAPDVAAAAKRLGPDPLHFQSNPERVWRKIQETGRPIGLVLMDQASIAGIGNVYRAEVLHRLRWHPLRPAKSLQLAEFEALWRECAMLLQLGSKAGNIVTVLDDEWKAARKRSSSKNSRDARKRRWVYFRKTCLICGGPVRCWALGGRVCFACEDHCQPPWQDASNADDFEIVAVSGNLPVWISAEQKREQHCVRSDAMGDEPTSAEDFEIVATSGSLPVWISAEQMRKPQSIRSDASEEESTCGQSGASSAQVAASLMSLRFFSGPPSLTQKYFTQECLQKMSSACIRKLLVERLLSPEGKKAVLIERYQKNLQFHGIHFDERFFGQAALSTKCWPEESSDAQALVALHCWRSQEAIHTWAQVPRRGRYRYGRWSGTVGKVAEGEDIDFEKEPPKAADPGPDANAHTKAATSVHRRAHGSRAPRKCSLRKQSEASQVLPAELSVEGLHDVKASSVSGLGVDAAQGNSKVHAAAHRSRTPRRIAVRKQAADAQRQKTKKPIDVADFKVRTTPGSVSDDAEGASAAHRQEQEPQTPRRGRMQRQAADAQSPKKKRPRVCSDSHAKALSRCAAFEKSSCVFAKLVYQEATLDIDES